MDVSFDAFSGTCERCGAKMYVTFEFLLDCRGYVFNELTLRVRGTAEAWIVIQAALSYQTDLEEMVEIAKFNGPTVSFVIGPVPMAVQWVIPVYVGYYTGASGHVDMRTDFYARFDLDMGLKLLPNDVRVWKTATLAATENDVVAMELVRATAYLGFYLQPCVYTGVSYVGQLSTCAAIVAVGEASATSTTISLNAYARIVGVLWGTFGLYLPGLGQVINYGTTYGPHEIFDQRDLIYSREIDIGSGLCSDTCERCFNALCFS